MAIVTFSNGIKVNFNGNPTQADIEEVAKKISNKPQDVNVLGSAIGGATQAFQQKEQATFNPLKIADKYFTSIGETAVNAWNELNTGYKSKTVAGKIGETGKTILGGVNTVLSPISSAFKAGEKVPVLGYVATGINSLFGAIGNGGGAITNNALNKLPVSDQTKEDLRPFVNEAGALASQIIAGKAGLDTAFAKANMKVLETLNKGIKRELPPEIASKMPDIPSEVPPTAPKMPQIASKESALTEYNKIATDLTTEAQKIKKISIPEELKQELYDIQSSKEILDMNPAKELGKYVSKRGEYAGRLKEVTGEGKSEFARTGDQIAENLGFEDSETARNAWEDYSTKKQELIKRENDIKQRISGYKLENKDNIAIEEFLNRQPSEMGNRVSGISKRIETNAIEKGLTDAGFDELAGYDSSTIKEQGKRGSQFSLDEHINMVKTGELPNGIKPATPFSIVEKYANETKNIELQKELAKSPLATKISESASELSLSRMREKEGAVAKIKEVIDSRKEKFKDQIKAEATKIKKSVGKPTKEAWLKFIEEIKC